ncbi:diguanylate cyclase [Massilia sp. 9096]|uniref:diguanylate cyclase n=1 Tax=Massilia sp. 9096 TaxID=1500894 RepID=UPI000A97F76C|nr:diguanylate cyclase [Massilia sp. 9096]
MGILFGAEPRLRRMTQYWSATALLYFLFLSLLGHCAALGLIDAGSMRALERYAELGIVLFFALVRFSPRLGLKPTTLAALQALFGISCNMWIYSIAGPMRGATLMGLMVVVVFCTFAMRPRQNLILTFTGLVGMGGTMVWQHVRDPVHYPATVEGVTFLLMALSTVAVAFLTGVMSTMRMRLKAQRAELTAALETIRVLATVDELTALANRRHMHAVLADEERRASAPGLPTCIALLDIDFFKQINDRHGHAAGDEVLRQFAAAARAELRARDVLARWGGEEFLLMLPDTAPGDALAVLARLRARVARLTLPEVAFERALSFSGGLTARAGGEPLSATVNRADKALYQAKSGGRDRVVQA